LPARRGWHVNRGLDHEADFFPASRFRDRFYKPEVVSVVLRTLDIETALKESGAKTTGPITAEALPPVIKILSPQQGEEVTGSPVPVRYSVRSPSGDRVTAIEIRVNGRPLSGGQGRVGLEDGPIGPSACHPCARIATTARDRRNNGTSGSCRRQKRLSPADRRG
jgi:hypothetical protein